jgi:adenine-specific DNA-methyltransferase
LSEYAILKARVGKAGADRLVAFGLIAPPDSSQETLDFFPALSGVKIPNPSPKQLPSRQAQLGQFMTPGGIANFMAGLFDEPFSGVSRLLDAGAGKGALTLAFMAQWQKRNPNGRLETHAFEVDAAMLAELRASLAAQNYGGATQTTVVDGDFIEQAATMIRLKRGPRFTHAILNPPYKKIGSSSAHRGLLRAAGLETVNLYSGFVGLAVELMENGGSLVAIIPRSFCNGPYYQPFRRFVLDRAAIRHIHLFDSRNKAFRQDSVLQENIIIHLVRGGRQGAVKISTSSDDTFSDYLERNQPFENIVAPNDPNWFIHIPTGSGGAQLASGNIRYELGDIGLSVSTGPVVDFRLRNELRADAEPGTVPLLYPGHFGGDGLVWPKPGFKKANAIRHNRDTAKWLFPAGFYAVTRRFSSKEEKRRIVANVVDPAALPDSMIGFENHLNVIHENRRPLSEDIARGIAAYLNSTIVDKHFRQFNGHTQVNAMDLKKMLYPSREALASLGVWAKSQRRATQEGIDARVQAIA